MLSFGNCVVLDGFALNPGDLSWSALLNIFPSSAIYDRTGLEQVVSRSKGAAVLLTNKTPLDRFVLSGLPDLRYIGVLATGFNIVDVVAAREFGITVTNIPAYGTASVAQFTIALLLELCCHVQIHSDAVRSGEWSTNPDWSFWKTPLIELDGKTLGIVGHGRIGSRVGLIAKALGMRTVRASETPLDRLFAESDVVSLHCPLSPDTKDLIDARRLALFKPSAFLVNTSRGGLVVEQDLADALNEGRLAGAAVDVLPLEPPRMPSPLFTAKNCLITPHIAWATREARSRLMETAVENIRCFLAGKPQNVV